MGKWYVFCASSLISQRGRLHRRHTISRQKFALVKIQLLLYRVLWVWLFSGGCAVLCAQDIHFSQFHNAPLNTNPALNGIFGGDVRFVGNYRSQWRAVPVPYTTFAVTAEHKLYYRPNHYDRYFTAGVSLSRDRQGALELTSLVAGIPIGLTLPLAQNNFLSVGVTPAFGQRSFNTTQWTFDAQFVDCLFDPTASTREDGTLFSDNLTYFDLSAGLNYRFQARQKRTRLDIGGAIHHVNRPRHNFWHAASDVRLAERQTLYGIGLVQVSLVFDVLGQALYQRQGSYRELVYGIGGRLLLNDKPYEELAVQLGVSFRHRYTDALIWTGEVHWKTWTLGFSYDLNLSDFVVATNNRGGPEVALIYRIYKIKPVLHPCPID